MNQKLDQLFSALSLNNSEQPPSDVVKTKALMLGAEVLVSENGNKVYHKVFGNYSIEDKDRPLEKGLVYDLGSLTQQIATTTIFMKLVEQQLLSPELRVSRVLQSFGSAGKEGMTLSHLLSHTSGFPASMPFHRTMIKGKPELNSLMTRRSALHILYNEIYRTRLENLPGKVFRQSDIGFLLLGEVLEVVSGMSLQKLYSQFVAKPFQLSGIGFIDLEQVRRKAISLDPSIFVPTIHCSWRGKRLIGESLDEVCWALGGISSHNGLFGTASDITNFCDKLISVYKGNSAIIDQQILKQFLTGYENTKSGESASEVQENTRPLGWQKAGLSTESNVLGGMGSSGVGFWIEPASGRVLVIATNAPQISRDQKRLNEFSLQVAKEVFLNNS